MAPGASATITAQFTPTDACVYVASCVCTVPEHKAHLMKLGGIGKSPFIAASCERLDFGPVRLEPPACTHARAPPRAALRRVARGARA